MDKQAIYQAFLHFYHADCANAAIHTAEVRFSPLTFRLAELCLGDSDIKWERGSINELHHVKNHLGKYEEDKGR